MDVKTKVIVSSLLFASVVWSADWYVDRENDGGTEDGTSWATAWGSLGDVVWASVNPGDTVYISGGVSTNKVYDLADYWVIEDGTSGNTNTYSIGQDEGHNGTAVFNYTGGDDKTWLWDLDYTIVTGDAGDGAQHFVLMGFANVAQGNLENSIVEYIRATNDIKQAISSGGYNSQNFTFRYCDLKGTDLVSGDNLISIKNTGAPQWDQFVIEQNTFSLPRSATNAGFGYDGIAGDHSTTFRYNTITYFEDTYEGPQHADGWQSSDDEGGMYCRVYGNTIMGCPNYAIYVAIRYAPGVSNLEIYNNVIVLGYPWTGSGTGGIIVGLTAGYPTGGGANTALFENVTIANNTIVDLDAGGAQPLNLASSATVTSEFVHCLIANNLLRTSNSIILTGNSTTLVTNNVVVSVEDAASYFESYTQGADSGDWSIVGAATPLIDTGYAMGSVFTTDITGLSRPSGSAWDIGAYEYDQGEGGGGDETAPELTSVVIASDGVTVVAGHDEAVTIGAGGSGGASLTGTWSGSVGLTYSSGSGTTGLTFAAASAVGDAIQETVTFSYTQPGDGIEDAAGNDLATVSGEATVNGSAQRTGPDRPPGRAFVQKP